MHDLSAVSLGCMASGPELASFPGSFEFSLFRGLGTRLAQNTPIYTAVGKCVQWWITHLVGCYIYIYIYHCKKESVSLTI